ncbi:MAG: flagellar hook capping FlgD N-terminal domain-containing protein [Eubacteriales bacterium]|nr:flagellar hook capping FlgD N-terminal domain-containing protein [Eubacteriales bacterium]
MDTSTVTSIASTLRALSDANSSSTSGSSELSQSDFLELLVAQLSYQDPLSSDSSSGSTDYVTQLATFTMLEQIQSMSEELATSQAYSLIGKYVYIEAGSDTLICGKVDGVVTEGGENYLLVGGETYSVSSIYGVVGADIIEGSSDQEVLESANLIGTIVTAEVTDEESGETTTVTGQVEKILIQDDVIYAVIGEQNVPVSCITEIAK